MSVGPNDTEQELLQKVAAGDEDAFRKIFHAHYQKLGAYVLGWTKSPSMAEEIVQDAFLKVWTNREALAGVERFESYLYVLARNHTYNALRQAIRERMRRQEWTRWLETDQHFPDEPIPEEYWQLIEEAVAKLPPRQQEVYRLKRQQGLKYEEIAAQLGISPETARKHQAAAIQQIRKYVQAHINIVALILSTPLLLVV